MTLWLLLREHPVMFVLLSGLVFFGWGEIFSLFPSTLTDTFGTAHATTNYGLLYMAQGIGLGAGWAGGRGPARERAILDPGVRHDHHDGRRSQPCWLCLC